MTASCVPGDAHLHAFAAGYLAGGVSMALSAASRAVATMGAMP
ncbi:MAG: hypothetical protein ACHP9Z_14905 [Streptosporangiales bacterium]